MTKKLKANQVNELTKQTLEEVTKATEDEIRLLEQAAEYISAANAQHGVLRRTQRLPPWDTIVAGLESMANRRAAHQSPEWAGREIARLRKLLEAAKLKVESR